MTLVFSKRPSDTDTFLDCTGFFRKQEMRYWWPVNVLEIANLQSRVISACAGHGVTLLPGRITTFAAVAVSADHSARPHVLVPRVDQILWTDRSELQALIYALVWRALPNRDKYLELWKEILADFRFHGAVRIANSPGLRELLRFAAADFGDNAGALQVISSELQTLASKDPVLFQAALAKLEEHLSTLSPATS